MAPEIPADAEAERQRSLDVLRSIAEHETGRLHAGDLPWTRWLDGAAQFGHYGFSNSLLIQAQRQDATDVRSYKQWQSADRQVRKGESGIRIVSPSNTPRSVFDVQQTDGPALGRREQTSPAEAWDLTRAIATDLGLYVDRGKRWNYAGRPDRRIIIDPELGDLAAASALAHQLAHVMRRGDRPDPPDASRAHCHGSRRVEADSVAHLLLHHLGAEPFEMAFPPVAAWAGDDPRAQPLATVKTVGDRVLRTASLLRRRLPPRAEPTAHPTARPKSMPAAQPVRHENAAISPDELTVINDAAHEFFRARAAGSWVRHYLKERGFDDDVQAAWQIGHAPSGWQALTDHLRSLRYSDEAILAAGLARTGRGGKLYDTFRDRAMFALRDTDGNIRGFIGRRPEQANGPKYLNSPEGPLFHKSELLFGAHEAKDRLASGARPVIVEGPLDAIAVSIASADHAAVAPCGTALTADQVAELGHVSDLDTTGVLVALDGDRAGRAATELTWRTLSQVKGPVGAALLPQNRDPADLLRYEGRMAVRDALASETALIDVVIDTAIERSGGRLDTAESRLAAARAAAQKITSALPTQAAQHASRIAQRTGITTQLITDILTSAISPEPAPETGPANDDFPLPPLHPYQPQIDASSRPLPAHPRPASRTRSA